MSQKMHHRQKAISIKAIGITVDIFMYLFISYETETLLTFITHMEISHF